MWQTLAIIFYILGAIGFGFYSRDTDDIKAENKDSKLEVLMIMALWPVLVLLLLASWLTSKNTEE